MSTQQVDLVPSQRGASEGATSESGANTGVKLTELNLWHLRREAREAEAKRKGRSTSNGSTQPLDSDEFDPMPIDPALPLVKPSSAYVPGLDWAKINEEAAKERNKSEVEEMKQILNNPERAHTSWLYDFNGRHMDRKSWQARWDALHAEATSQIRAEKRSLQDDEVNQDDDTITKIRRLDPHGVLAPPGSFSSPQDSKGRTPAAPEEILSTERHQKERKARSDWIFGRASLKEPRSMSSALPQQRTLFGSMPPNTPTMPQQQSLFGNNPPKTSAEAQQSSLFGKMPSTTSTEPQKPWLFGTMPPKSSEEPQQQSLFASKPPNSSVKAETPWLFGSSNQAVPPTSTKNPQPKAGLFGLSEDTPATSLAVQASESVLPKPQQPSTALHLENPIHKDTGAYLAMPNLFGGPFPPSTGPTTRPLFKQPSYSHGPQAPPNAAPSNTNAFQLDTIAERIFESENANEVSHPLDESEKETGAPLDLDSFLPGNFPGYYSTTHLNETGLFLSRAKYFISLAGAPSVDMTYGIVVVPFGEERLLLCGHSVTNGCENCSKGEKGHGGDGTGEVRDGEGENNEEAELEASRHLRDLVDDCRALRRRGEGDPSFDSKARWELEDHDRDGE